MRSSPYSLREWWGIASRVDDAARSFGGRVDEPFDPDKPPPEPPDILDVFENQGYISKLIQWGLEASKRERSRPHLVERDDDLDGEC